MARLNEPPAPVESLESLKRRFIRQNRDLARCNSQQSMKIRALETDLLHQLSENATLRTRLLSLETELLDARAYDVRQNLGSFRVKLQAQFQGILTELGELEKKPRRRKSQAPSTAASPKRSPQRREWRNTSTLSEVLASQGALMPTITEGKHFPRKTMESVDIVKLIDDAESPDMAPPRTFLDQERRDSDPRLVAEARMKDNASDPMGAVDIRRRRRETRLHEPASDDESTAHPIKAGAKRKFAASESRQQPELESSPRKVLGEKSVNTDPVSSPQKPARTGKEFTKPIDAKSIKPSARDVTTKPAPRPSARVAAMPTRPRSAEPRPPARLTDAKPEPRPSSVASTRADASPKLIKLEPKTPNPLDILSPPSTQPSASSAPDDTRPGTPPPSSIPATNTSADPNGVAAATGGRGSLRRNRGDVSYAEPKLNVKMRRPGKELADAVVKKEGRTSDAAAAIKIEPTPTPATAPTSSVDIPGSPLDAKRGLERTAVDIFEVEASPPPQSRSVAASDREKSLPALPAGARTVRRQTVGAAPASATENAAGQPLRDVRVVRARRLSSVGAPREGESDGGKSSGAGAGAGSLAGRGARSVSDLRAERAERIAERRRSMML